MSDRDALLAAILAHPDEDTPRLAFADWLDEHGDAPRAEFVRVQVELARQFEAEADLPESFGTSISGGYSGYNIAYRPHDLPERLALLGKEAELLHHHGEEWKKGLPTYATNAHTKRAIEFRRGFVGHVMAALGPLMKSPGALWRHHPVESLRLENAGGAARLKVPACKSLAALRELRLNEPRYSSDLLGPYCESPHLAGVRVLKLNYGDMESGAVRLAGSNFRPVALDVACGGLDGDEFQAMLYGRFTERLRRFRPYRVGSWAADMIAFAPLPELRLLDLGGCEVGDDGVRALTRSKHLKQLVTLDLGYNDLTDAALEALAAWPGLASLQSLNVGDNPAITERGVAALVRSPHLKPIHLGLRRTATGDAGAKALAAWPGLANLIDLDLSYAQVGDAGAVALADSPHWRDLRYLKLSGSGKLGVAAVARLREKIGGRKVDVLGW